MLLSFLIAAVATSAGATPAGDPPPPVRWNEATTRLFAAMVAKSEGGNVGLFAPAFLPALDLLDDGAVGKTREEFVAALGAPDHAGNRQRAAQLRTIVGDRFDSGVRVWVEESLEVGAPWQKLLAQQDGKSSLDRFALATLDRTQLAKEFNDWASGVVDQPVVVVRESDLGGMLRLLLGCAARVEWRWEKPFDPKWTKELEFHANAADATPVPTMELRDEFRRFEVAGLQGVRLPCEGGLALDLVRVGHDAATREQLLARPTLLAEIDAALDEAKPERLLVALPKVDSFTLHDLAPPLRALGVATAFDPSAADFSALAGKPGELFVGLARHACGVKWDETGGKAIGVTVVAMKGSAPKKNELRFDVPFLALLRAPDGAVLLAQWIAQPVAKE
jgi:serpin B